MNGRIRNSDGSINGFFDATQCQANASSIKAEAPALTLKPTDRQPQTLPLTIAKIIAAMPPVMSKAASGLGGREGLPGTPGKAWRATASVTPPKRALNANTRRQSK